MTDRSAPDALASGRPAADPLLTPPPPWAGRLFWLEACLLFALAQVLLAGYQLGAGNQSIQIPFLYRLHDPRLFPVDAMVNQTLADYPSLFYVGLSRLLSVAEVPTLYLTLHLLATFGVFLAVTFLARAVFGHRGAGPLAGLLAALMLLAGHHQALAGETLYSVGFTHTWAVFPLGLLALAFFYRGQLIAAFLLTGLLFNLHALEAGYLAAFLGLWALCSLRSLGRRKTLGLAGLLLAAAAPTLFMLLRHRQNFDGTWLQLTHIRSAAHSFPSSWWQAGNPDIPRFVMVVALAALAMSFPAPASRQRKTASVAVAAGLMFLIGYVFADIWPMPTVIRAQLFRVSRFVMVLAFLYIAHGAAGAWGLFRSARASGPRWPARLELASAVLTLLCLALPPLLVLLPVALLAATVVTLINGRLAWWQALASGAAMLVVLLAWRTIHFPLPGSSSDLSFRMPSGWVVPTMLALMGVGLWLTPQVRKAQPAKLLAVAAGAAPGVLLLAIIVAVHLARQSPSDAGWVAAQMWARDPQNTPTDALFLTPIEPGGFRIFSQRSVVGERRDGTQLYFSADFAGPWWDAMHALQPGLLYNRLGARQVAAGTPLGDLEDAKILELCDRYHADYVVLPSANQRGGQFKQVYDQNGWSIYRRVTLLASAPVSAQQGFLDEVVAPNIEKYRKSDAVVQVVDADGRPVYDAPYQIVQTSSSFGFGCTLPFFQAPPRDPSGDFQPPAVKPAELERFREIFNYSVIGPSGWWSNLESETGKPRFDGLDQYVNWCNQNRVRVEFHFLSGFQPLWLTDRPLPEQAKLLLAHAHQLVSRYGSKIDCWQVVDQRIGLDASPAVFADIRKTLPKSRLGISDCTRFDSFRPEALREQDMTRGLDDVRALARQKITVDFAAFHAHQPVGLWADGQVMYDMFDRFAKESVKIHISEFGVPDRGVIEGDVQRGQWTPELQAQYYCEFLTICFSHPAVEVVNLMGLGPATPIPGAGLLDARDQPTLAFAILKDLITQRWRTRLAGKLGVDGRVDFRGFHGEYELAVTVAPGQVVRTTFSVAPGEANTFRFKLDRQAGTLTP